MFVGDNEEMPWFAGEVFRGKSKEIRKLYQDFAVERDGRFGCPQNFNRLTMSWYLNEPKLGDLANVGCLSETFDFYALRIIEAGEELTVDYSTYSDPPAAVTRRTRSTR